MHAFKYNGYQLKPEDVRALRKADTVCFDWNKDGNDEVDSQIRANKGREDSGSGFEETVRIPVDGRINDYSGDDGEVLHCFEMLHHGQDLQWQTIAGTLRAGDVIVLVWNKDCGSMNVRGARVNGERLYTDMLQLRVARPRKSGTIKEFEFLVRTSMCADNSARMIKGRRW